jgi:hypothetical protein
MNKKGPSTKKLKKSKILEELEKEDNYNEGNMNMQS